MILTVVPHTAEARTEVDYYRWDTAIKIPKSVRKIRNRRKKFLKIAASQIGYISDNANNRMSVYSKFIMDKKGITTWDYTQYMWCSEFVSWCAYKAGLKKWVPCDSIEDWKANYPKRIYTFSMEGHDPANKILNIKDLKPGDIIFVSTVKDPMAEAHHTAIVERVNVKRGRVYTIEGNKRMEFFQDVKGKLGPKNKLYVANHINTGGKRSYYKDKNGKKYRCNFKDKTDTYRGVRRTCFETSQIHEVLRLNFSR